MAESRKIPADRCIGVLKTLSAFLFAQDKNGNGLSYRESANAAVDLSRIVLSEVMKERSPIERKKLLTEKWARTLSLRYAGDFTQKNGGIIDAEKLRSMVALTRFIDASDVDFFHDDNTYYCPTNPFEAKFAYRLSLMEVIGKASGLIEQYESHQPAPSSCNLLATHADHSHALAVRMLAYMERTDRRNGLAAQPSDKRLMLLQSCLARTSAILLDKLGAIMAQALEHSPDDLPSTGGLIEKASQQSEKSVQAFCKTVTEFTNDVRLPFEALDEESKHECNPKNNENPCDTAPCG